MGSAAGRCFGIELIPRNIPSRYHAIIGGLSAPTIAGVSQPKRRRYRTGGWFQRSPHLSRLPATICPVIGQRSLFERVVTSN